MVKDLIIVGIVRANGCPNPMWLKTIVGRERANLKAPPPPNVVKDLGHYNT